MDMHMYSMYMPMYAGRDELFPAQERIHRPSLNQSSVVINGTHICDKRVARGADCLQYNHKVRVSAEPSHRRSRSHGDDINRLAILQASSGFYRHVHRRHVGSPPAWAVGEEFRF